MPKTYHSVPLDEEQSGHGPTQEKRVWSPSPDSDDVIPRTAGGIKRHWMWLAHALLLSVSMSLFALSYYASSANPANPKFLSKVATYSPLFPAVKYELQRYTLALVMKNNPFVGYGGTVDQAWNHIANDIGDIMITEEERVKLGLSPRSLRIQHPKTGEWGYRAGVEVFHQLHCLNLVRQFVYKDYYNNTAIGGDVGTAANDADLFGHMDHCIEAIRQNLMCQSDVGVFTFKTFPEYEADGITGEWPDFEINHMCRNYEDIRKWNNDHVVAWTHDV